MLSPRKTTQGTRVLAAPLTQMETSAGPTPFGSGLLLGLLLLLGQLDPAPRRAIQRLSRYSPAAASVTVPSGASSSVETSRQTLVLDLYPLDQPAAAVKGWCMTTSRLCSVTAVDGGCTANVNLCLFLCTGDCQRPRSAGFAVRASCPPFTPRSLSRREAQVHLLYRNPPPPALSCPRSPVRSPQETTVGPATI